jgi:hypothetical protein
MELAKLTGEMFAIQADVSNEEDEKKFSNFYSSDLALSIYSLIMPELEKVSWVKI